LFSFDPTKSTSRVSASVEAMGNKISKVLNQDDTKKSAGIYNVSELLKKLESGEIKVKKN